MVAQVIGALADVAGKTAPTNEAVVRHIDRLAETQRPSEVWPPHRRSSVRRGSSSFFAAVRDGADVDCGGDEQAPSAGTVQRPARGGDRQSHRAAQPARSTAG